MEIARQLRQVALVVVAAALVLPYAVARARDVNAEGSERELSGVRLQIDNDLLAGRNLDRDYTGGVAITLSGTAARDGLLSLDPLLSRIDDALESEAPAQAYHARQIGLMAFTPNDTLTAEAQPDDRPYASLLFISNGRVRVDADDRGAWSSSLTIGALGLSLSESLHNVVHELVGSESPHGYDHQISAGGEPTARYTLARHKLWIADPSGQMDVKTTLQGSVGYLTEASAGISARIGRFDTPWWSFAPELGQRGARARRPELYFFTGARLKVRAYNAFLQGQFRDSEVRYSFDEIEPVVVEAWIGVVTQLFDQTELSYTLHYQTAELRDGRADRDSFWGAIQLAHAF
jgi:hypothetical protein